MPPTLAVPDGHRRAIESLVRVLSCLQNSGQMQEESLDEFCARSHEAVELRAAWQGGEGTAQVSLGVPVEVPLAPEAAPAGEDKRRLLGSAEPAVLSCADLDLARGRDQGSF